MLKKGLLHKRNGLFSRNTKISQIHHSIALLSKNEMIKPPPVNVSTLSLKPSHVEVPKPQRRFQLPEITPVKKPVLRIEVERQRSPMWASSVPEKRQDNESPKLRLKRQQSIYII